MKEKNYILLAGENTDVVTSGSLSECLAAMYTLPSKNLPLDRWAHRSGFVVVEVGTGIEHASGWFDREQIHIDTISKEGKELLK